MDVQPIVTRLRQQLVDLPLREIDGAAGLDAARRGNRSAPAVYVLPLGEKAQATPLLGRTEHQETRLFGIVTVLDVHDFDRKSVLNLDTLRQRIKQALVGWPMDASTGEPVRFANGDLAQFEGDGRLWWIDEFFVTAYFRSSAP